MTTTTTTTSTTTTTTIKQKTSGAVQPKQETGLKRKHEVAIDLTIEEPPPPPPLDEMPELEPLVEDY